MGCEEGSIGWIETVFGECVRTSRDKWSFAVGMISNFMWVISSAPQIYTNCKSKRVEGQSWALFTLMFTGNVLSLIGVIITGGLVTQVITSTLYCILDGIMFVQFWWYGYIKPCLKRRRARKNGIQSSSFSDEEAEDHSQDTRKLHIDDEGEPDQVPDGDGPPTAGLAGAMFLQAASAATDWKAPYTGDQTLGTVFGWIGGCIYIGSRIPQVIKNFKNGKVIDLSPIYVSFTIFGNLTYTLSVFIKDTSGSYLWKQAPFIFGAVGPMMCDFLFTFQMCICGIEAGAARKQESSEEHPPEEESEGENVVEL